MTYLNDKAVLLVLLLLAGTLFFLRLGAPGLFDADEPAYAQAAREMLERGDWVTPHFNGRPRFDKPILFYWLILASYSVFGVTEFAVRFWSALAGLGLVLLLWSAARRWIGREAALWTGVAFSTNLLTAVVARAGVTDMLLTFFVTAAILAGLAALEEPAAGGRWKANIMWAGMALAVLVKGPVGVLVPVMALGGCLIVSREVRAGVRHLCPWEGFVLFLAMAVPWYALALLANGWAFIEGFVIKHHVTRYVGVVSSHAGPFWFYVPVLLVGFFPWSGFLPSALWRAAQAVRGRRAGTPGDRLLLACLCWLTGVFVFFSLAGTKLPSYLFAAFPAAALMVGSAIACTYHSAERRAQRAARHAPCAEEPAVPRWISALTPWLIGITGGMLAVGFVVVPLVFDQLRPLARGILDGVAPPTGISWGLAGLLLAGVSASLLARRPWQATLLCVMMSGVILVAVWAAAPRAYAILQAPLREFAEESRGMLRPGDPVVVYGLNAPSIVFYAQRRVKSIGRDVPGEVEAAVRGLADSGGQAVVITRSSLTPRLNAIQGLVLRKSRGGYALFVSGDESADAITAPN